jgi:hypothetical protein
MPELAYLSKKLEMIVSMQIGREMAGPIIDMNNKTP